MLRNFLAMTTLGGFTRGFREIRHLRVFGGIWAPGEIPDPNRQNKFGPETNVDFFFRCGFKKNVLHVKTECFVFSFSALGALSRGRAH